jgi:hypothetical protein
VLPSLVTPGDYLGRLTAAAEYARVQLELLRPLWPDYDLWVVQGVRPAPDVYCAGLKGTPAACVNAGVPRR